MATQPREPSEPRSGPPPAASCRPPAKSGSWALAALAIRAFRKRRAAGWGASLVVQSTSVIDVALYPLIGLPVAVAVFVYARRTGNWSLRGGAACFAILFLPSMSHASQPLYALSSPPAFAPRAAVAASATTVAAAGAPSFDFWMTWDPRSSARPSCLASQEWVSASIPSRSWNS